MKRTSTNSISPVMDETNEVVVSAEKKESLQIVVEASRLNVREKAKAGANIIAVVEKGRVFDATKANEDWYKIAIDGKTGYVLANFVSVR